MVATAAHLADHVSPPLPVRQWVLAVPKRLRYFLHRDADLPGSALRLFLRMVEERLRAHSPGAGSTVRLGAWPPLAAHFGLPYAYAYFFSEGRGVEEVLRPYRDNFRPQRPTSAADGHGLHLGARR